MPLNARKPDTVLCMDTDATRPHLPINRENLDRLTLALERMTDAASDAARRAEVGLRRVAEIMQRHARQ